MSVQILQPGAAEFALERGKLPAAEVPGLYVHIPFCVHKCGYCDFYSITRQSAQRMEGFVELMLREADGWAGWGGGGRVLPRTVFFGGGTPTLLPLEAMRRLILGLRERFDFSRCVEWTVEANPATVTQEYCRMLGESGVTRISMGAQSFRPAELRLLERHHDPEDVPKGLELARAAGISRLNIDLIYAIPGQTMAGWMENLETAIGLGTEHLSCYGLTYEANTPLTVRRRLGQVKPAEESLELEMMRQTRKRLEAAGLPAYEISNFAKPGCECGHNLLYWTGESYVGLGPSAASHVSGWRWKNRPHLGQWESCIEADQLAAAEVEQLSPRRRAGELAMLLLRLSRGIEFSEFFERTGFDAKIMFSDAIGRLGREGLIVAGKDSIRLGEAGLAVADGVAAEFLAACAES
ncbi:MAG: radical SAM family heme chaperone HemW [Tepidisphaeraceae bacterium]